MEKPYIRRFQITGVGGNSAISLAASPYRRINTVLVCAGNSYSDDVGAVACLLQEHTSVDSSCTVWPSL